MGSSAEPAARICLQLSSAPAGLNHESVRKQPSVRSGWIFKDFLVSVGGFLQEAHPKMRRWRVPETGSETASGTRVTSAASVCFFRLLQVASPLGLLFYVLAILKTQTVLFIDTRGRRWKRRPLLMRLCVFFWQEVLTVQRGDIFIQMSFRCT